MEQRFIPLLFVVMLAFIAPVILGRCKRVPVVVGEISAGILVGPSVLNWVGPDDIILEILAEIGFAFLMFLSGLEIDFSIVTNASRTGRSTRTNPVMLAALSFGTTLALAAGIGLWLTHAGYVRDPWMTTLILSTTSLGIVVPVLKEKRMTSGRLGQTILLCALFADFLTMLLITAYIAAKSSGFSLDILLICLLFIPALLIWRFGRRHLRRPGVRRYVAELADATSQIRVRASFALMMAFVVMAELIGAELILGAFLGGVAASLLTEPGDAKIRHKLDAIGFGFFIPLFFIFVGVRFDLRAFLDNPDAWILLPVLLCAAFAIKVVSALPLRLAHSWRETLASGVLLSARLSLIVAASAIGVRLGAISESTNAAIILVAALTSMLAPLGFNLFVFSPGEKRKRVTLIFHVRDFALQVARELRARGSTVLFAAQHADAAEHARAQGFDTAPHADSLAATINALARDTRVDAFVALSGSADENLEACRTARAQGITHVLALVTDPMRIPEFRHLDAQALTPSLHLSSLLAFLARNPAFFSVITTPDDQRDLREFVLTNPALCGKRLMEVKFPPNTLVLAIRRHDEMIIPNGTTRLTSDDRLTVLGDLETLAAMADWLET